MITFDEIGGLYLTCGLIALLGIALGLWGERNRVREVARGGSGGTAISMVSPDGADEALVAEDLRDLAARVGHERERGVERRRALRARLEGAMRNQRFQYKAWDPEAQAWK